jgi:hypothetical protein
MKEFLSELKARNELLYVNGWIFLAGALFCIIMLLVTDIQVLGINTWYKPFKFFLSSAVFLWTMGWLMHYLNEPGKVNIYSWVAVMVLGFELSYIAIKAAQGELSHFNVSNKLNAIMFPMMGVAITLMTAWTAYIAYLFFQKTFPQLPDAYVWGIRLGLVIFVIFAFAGGIMAAKLSHNVGGEMITSKGLPVLNWSRQFGDLRVAHFFGMHALQILPLIGFYVSKTKSSIIIIAMVYAILTTATLVQAIMGKPLIRF